MLGNFQGKILWFFFLFLFQMQAFGFSEVCVVGDTGTGEKEQFQVAQAMYNARCKTIIHTGDVIYEFGVKSESDRQWLSKFEDPFSVLIEDGAEFYMSLGNHDYAAGSSEKLKKVHVAYAQKNSFYKFPDLYYKFKVGSVCFWSLDSNRVTDEQLSFLERTMTSEKNCDWKVAFGHHPIYSSGKHGNAKPKSHLKTKIEPLLIKHTEIYFAGHDHNLADEGSFPNSLGYRQIISGAGAKLRSVKKCKETGCAYVESKLGFVKAYFKKDSVVMDFLDINLNVLNTTTVNKKGLDLYASFNH